jgi:hypothetical protein
LNFLAHFLTAYPHPEDDVLIGALLPDIAKRAGVGLNAGKIKEEKGLIFHPLLSGIRLHWFADKKFHQSNLFQLGVALWKAHLEKRFPGAERKFFLFHLLFEMWLDRLLLQQQPHVGLEMYDSLKIADTENLNLFSSRSLGDRKGSLVKTYQGFVEKRFVLDYADPERFARIGTEVFGYVTQQPFQEQWVSPVLDSLLELQRFEADVLYIWELFLSDLKSDWEKTENPSGPF